MTFPKEHRAPPEVSARVLRALRMRRPLWRFLRSFCRAAHAAGASSHLVGGFVRDLVEGRPGKDVDLMVSGIGFGEVGDTLRSLPARDLGIRRIVKAGRLFAVYKVATAWSGEDIDVALARPDGIDVRNDAAHRDFTINSLLFSFRVDGNRLSGDVIDFFGGLADLRRGLIRGVGDPTERFTEDPLRILRAIRQKNERPGYAIERRTWSAIRRAGPRLVATVPGERLAGELIRSLSADPAGTVGDLHRSGILPLILPGAPRWSRGALSRVKRRYALLERRLGRPLPETVLLACLLVDAAERERAFRLAGLLPPASGPVAARAPGMKVFRLPLTEAAARRLHVPQVRRVVQMVEDLSRLDHSAGMPNRHAWIESILARWEDPGPLIALYEAAAGAASRKAVDLRPLWRRAAEAPPLLSGRDLIEMGVPAGPGVERILERVREATLTGGVTRRDEAARLAASLCGDERLPLLPHRKIRSSSSARRRPRRRIMKTIV